MSSVLLHTNDFDFPIRKMYRFENVIDMFLLLGKFHIPQSKWTNSKPNFDHFKTAFKMYFESVKLKKKKIEKPKDLYLC